MKRIFLNIILIIAFSLFTDQIAFAEESLPETPAAVLCLPGEYQNIVMDCQPDGPSAYLTEMAKQKVTFPVQPFPAVSPDFGLTYPSVAYGEVRTFNAPVYGSMEDALQERMGKAIRRIDSPFSYISYSDSAIIDGRRVYMVAPGSWMTAVDVIRITPPRFQGYQFAHRLLLVC